MLMLRNVVKSDLDSLLSLAERLDTVNLPSEPGLIEQMIDLSVRSFSGRIKDPLERTYVFVLEESRTKEILGTSQIIAQHGTREAPHVFLDVYEREHYSAVIDRHFRHKVLQIGYNYEGHTEIGGLVVHPHARGKGKPGKQVSFVRFLFMAMHPDWFCERVLAELMPPLLEGGRSAMWDSFGERVTGLDYREADALSRQSKEFIKELFPQGEIYVELMPAEVREVIEQVGPETKPVEKMLRSIGFEYDQRIDPFDGGPHFSAPLKSITLVKGYACGAAGLLEGEGEERLVALERPEGEVRFLALRSPCRVEAGEVRVPEETLEALGAGAGTLLHTIPFS